MVQLQGYNSKKFYRDSVNLGGGIKVYYLDHIEVDIITNLISPSCESLIIKSTIPGFGKLCIFSVYRPPHAALQDFYDFIESIFEHFEDQYLVMLGDMNIDALDINSTQTAYYANLLESYGYTNEISLPTHVNQVTNMDGSCLDHIVHNLHASTESYVLSPNISDHYAVAMLLYEAIL